MKMKEKPTEWLLRFGRVVLVECAKVVIGYYITEIPKGIF